VRILKDLPRNIKVLDIPGAEKTCRCCNGRLTCIGVESS
jgi:transposase